MDKPRRILFLSVDSKADSRLAELWFEAEANKMDVFWHPISRTLSGGDGIESDTGVSESTLRTFQESGIDTTEKLTQPREELTGADLESSDLTVFLERREGVGLLKA
ncbi:MAG: hypothetical protein K2Z81_20875, partial [Cyanobacteria bacterium]|nr:hypothetical protein [Cyanobacteriota bacterium]